MWPRFPAVQTQYGCSPWETTCCISEHHPSKAHAEMLQMLTVYWTDWNLTMSLVKDLEEMGFLWRGPETQSTAEVSELPLSWYACHYPQMFDMEPHKWATLITAFLGQNRRGLQGRPIQSIEVALSAVIREFKHSTSLQDDTSLNSLSTHHLPAHLTWLCDMIFLQTINQLPPSLCLNYHAALEPLVTFLYAALFVNIYLGLYSSKRCLCTIIAEQSWEIV